ncbi:hypothetical protein HYT25_04265 [Candidatus Pacearchaeota archaeon]|nr:hypothetical protein [Candidatus Pacearchaeota archaeon]
MEYLARLVNSGIKVRISGQFLRNVEGVENDLKALSPEFIYCSDEEREQKRIAIERDRKPYDFSLDMFSLDSETGLFVAGCNDDFGKSGVVGLMGKQQGEYAGIMTFQKSYVRGEDSLAGRGGEIGPERDFRNNLFSVFYSGIHWLTSGNEFSAKGEYVVNGRNFKFMGGTWEMKLQLP